MSRPLKIDNNTSPISLKEMSDVDIEYITYRVLYEFANTQTGTGTLNLDGIGTNIGSFVDTSRPYNVGQHPVGTEINTNTIVFYQDRRSVEPNPTTRPVIWNGSGIQEINNSELNDLIMFNAAIKLTNGGIGSYFLGTSSPSNGTWIEIDSFNDSLIDGSVEYKLFRKINDAEPPAVRPFKTITNGLREMNDEEIQALVNNFRDYIQTTGIGYYQLQSSAPTNGTHVNLGDTITDTRRELGDISYTGTRNFTGSRVFTSIGNYTGTRTFTGFGTFSQFFGETRVSNGQFFGATRIENYTGTRSFTGTRTFTGSRSYTGTRSFTGFGTFVGTTVLNGIETISTKALWVKQS
jgi:hypothetical protein